MNKRRLSKTWFYILSYIWGLPLTLIGLAVTCVLRLLGYKPKKWGGSHYFVVGKNWGGLSIGTTIVVSERSNRFDILNHEFGHSVQNCYFGFLCPFLVTIPSFVRACYREFVVWAKLRSYAELPDYYGIWFEKQASELGEANIDCWRL